MNSGRSLQSLGVARSQRIIIIFRPDNCGYFFDTLTTEKSTRIQDLVEVSTKRSFEAALPGVGKPGAKTCELQCEERAPGQKSSTTTNFDISLELVCLKGDIVSLVTVEIHAEIHTEKKEDGCHSPKEQKTVTLTFTYTWSITLKVRGKAMHILNGNGEQ